MPVRYLRIIFTGVLCCSLIASVPAQARGGKSLAGPTSFESEQKAFEGGQKHLEKARAVLEKGDTGRAIVEYAKSIEVNPASVESYLELGELYSKINEAQKAVERLDIGISMALLHEICDPGIGRYCCLLARNYQRLGRSDLASGALVKAQKYLSDDPLPLFFLGEIQAERGKFKEAAAAFREALRRGNSNVEWWLALGKVGLRGKLPNVAQEAYQGLMTIDPEKASELEALMKSVSPTRTREETAQK